jgi:hypothetical protein
MAGALTISTLNNDTGVLATQNGMTGIAKAWVNFNGTTATPSTIRDSFNVSSVTRRATGQYTVNFTTAMPNANYAAVGTHSDVSGDVSCTFISSSVYGGVNTTTASTVNTTFGSALTNPTYVFVVFFSS